MSENQKWDYSDAERGFDNAFDSATTGAGPSAEDAAKKAQEANERAEYEQQKQQWEQRIADLKHEIEVGMQQVRKMVDNYKDLASLADWRTVFKADDKEGVKKKTRSMSKNLHADKFGSFVGEIKTLADDAFKVLQNFKDEAYFELDPLGEGKSGANAGRNRRSAQARMSMDINARVEEALQKQELVFSEKMAQLQQEFEAWEAQKAAAGNENAQNAEQAGADSSQEQTANNEQQNQSEQNGPEPAGAAGEGAQAGTQENPQGNTQESQTERMRRERQEDARKAERANERKNRIEALHAEVEIERKQYLEVDYKRNTAFKRLREYFGNRGKTEQEKDKNTETDPEVAKYRAYYDAKLMQLQELMLEDAKERGASNEELADLFGTFRMEQKITLAAEHDKVRVEQQAGTLPGFVGEKMVWLAKSYQKLPLSVKLGVGATFMAGGLAAGMAGGVAVGAFAGVALTRRIAMGLITGTGVRLTMEARGQMKDEKNLDAERDAFLEQLSFLDEEAKFNLLKGNIENIVIKDSENTINQAKNQDLKQQAVGVAVGTFLASGFGSSLVKAGFGKVAGLFGYGAGVENVAADAATTSGNGADLGSYENFKNMYGGEGGQPGATGLNLEHHEQVAGGASGEQLLKPVTGGLEKVTENVLSIEKGSSIEKTLIEHLKVTHPEMKNYGDMAHRIWLDYMDHNQEQIIKNVGIEEYQKMLKDGMVNVKPGTTLIMDPENPLHLQEIGGKISHLNVAAAAEDIAAPETEVELPKAPVVEVAPVSQEEVVAKVLAEKEAEKIAAAQHSFADAHKDYDQAMRGRFESTTPAEENASLERQGMAEKIMRESAESIKGTEEYRNAMKNSLKLSLDMFKEKDVNLLAGNENLPADRAMADEILGKKLKNFTSVFQNMVKENVKLHGGDYVPTFKPEEGETVKHFMQRVILKATESKFGILRG